MNLRWEKVAGAGQARGGGGWAVSEAPAHCHESTRDRCSGLFDLPLSRSLLRDQLRQKSAQNESSAEEVVPAVVEPPGKPKVATSLGMERFAISDRAAAAFRAALGALVAAEAADRFGTLEWLYTDSGALPRAVSMPSGPDGWLVRLMCVHAWSVGGGSLAWAQALAVVQVAAAAALAAGSHPRAAAGVCWLLHVSSCLRNVSLIYILDRYLHLLLWYAIFLPPPRPTPRRAASGAPPRCHASAASVCLALQLLAIYADAGWGKASDPDRSWRWDAPVAALDTYLRHTSFGRLARALLGATGLLRLGGAAAVAVELLAAPLAFLIPVRAVRRACIVAAASLHVLIALSMRNTALLSAAAITAWLPFWDVPGAAPRGAARRGGKRGGGRDGDGEGDAAAAGVWNSVASPVLLCFAVGVVRHQWTGGAGPGCGAGRASADSFVNLMLHNRWNVFTSAERHVVWEVAPARLSDGSVEDIWRGEIEVAWGVPLGAEPARRRGRWRAFPYMAERGEREAAAFWGAVCDEWERHDARGRAIEGFHFYMLQADARPVEDEIAEIAGEIAGEIDEVEAAASASAAGSDSAGHRPFSTAALLRSALFEGALGGERSYGEVRKRLVVRFQCAGRQSPRPDSDAGGIGDDA